MRFQAIVVILLVANVVGVWAGAFATEKKLNAIIELMLRRDR
jgi:hypothetical protein